MVSDKFRRQLRQEVELWQAEGLINADLYKQLSQRYQFNALETAARDRFVTILLGLGSLLIGLGIITFVAANWQELPRAGRVTLLLSLFVGVNLAGFYLWRQPKGAQHRLGHGLLLLGSLILGANMGLMGQMFHIGGAVYELLLAWGVGVLAMAYSLRLTSLGIISIILMGLGYWGFWAEYVQQTWSSVPQIQDLSWAWLMGEHMPVLAGLMFVPLAYWCRSPVIFGLSAIAVISSLEGNLQPFSLRMFSLSPIVSTGWALAIAFALPPALLWAYDDSWWVHGDVRRVAPAAFSGSWGGSFRAIARTISVIFLGILFYSASSLWFWELFSNLSPSDRPQLNWFPLIDAFILSGVALVEWIRLLSQARNPRTRQNLDLTTLVIGVFIIITALIPFWHISVTQISLIATFAFNALLFLLAAGLMREGLAQGDRRAFWGGMVLLTLRILTWFLLANTELIFKSIVFILCGFGVIAIGLWFERYVRTLSHNSKALRRSESPTVEKDF